jgi:hypothetical protein
MDHSKEALYQGKFIGIAKEQICVTKEQLYIKFLPTVFPKNGQSVKKRPASFLTPDM